MCYCTPCLYATMYMYGMSAGGSPFPFPYRDFNTEVDIRLRKWADSLSLANLCIKVSFDDKIINFL